MQGLERIDEQLTDTEALAGHLVPAGSMFAFLAAHRAGLFPDAGYADLFAPPGVGRPSLPATRMAAIMTLQALHDYSDRETAEAVRFDVRWKVAIGVREESDPWVPGRPVSGLPGTGVSQARQRFPPGSPTGPPIRPGWRGQPAAADPDPADQRERADVDRRRAWAGRRPALDSGAADQAEA